MHLPENGMTHLNAHTLNQMKYRWFTTHQINRANPLKRQAGRQARMHANGNWNNMLHIRFVCIEYELRDDNTTTNDKQQQTRMKMKFDTMSTYHSVHSVYVGGLNLSVLGHSQPLKCIEDDVLYGCAEMNEMNELQL